MNIVEKIAHTFREHGAKTANNALLGAWLGSNLGSTAGVGLGAVGGGLLSRVAMGHAAPGG